MTHRNLLFPYVYRFGTSIFDLLFYRRYRRETMSNATGRLLMVGLGPGTDLMFLPPAVTSVAALEPVPAFRRMGSAVVRRPGSVLVGGPFESRTAEPSPPSPRPDSIPGDCAAFEPLCRPRAHLICKDS